MYSCYICLELLYKCQLQHCHFCPPLWHAKTFWHLFNMCCVPAMVLQQHCLCFLEALTNHLLPPLLVQDPLFFLSHSRFIRDVWMAGDHHLLCLKASLSRIMKVGKDPLVRGLSSRLGRADWVRNGGSGGQGPLPAESCLPAWDRRIELQGFQVWGLTEVRSQM